MNIEKIEKQVDLIKTFTEDYKQDVLFGSLPDGNVPAEKIINWIIRNKYLVDLCGEIKDLEDDGFR